jgi:N-acetylglucosaminyldiphosphoundecaprenol N-acetyl-beta-D-mannosaminyltransferase
MRNILLSEKKLYNQELTNIKDQKLLITTLNAHCFNLAQQDSLYYEALCNSDILLPDGISIVYATYFLTGVKLKKIAGADLFFHEMNRLNANGGTCFFLGSSISTLEQISKRASYEYPQVRVYQYSPPYKQEFSSEDNVKMLSAINTCKPDVLFIGMTAPKQEKWAYVNISKLNAKHICCVGAVFDFYAGTVIRAPGWIIGLGLEWFYRLIKEPVRMWKRYLIGNPKFMFYILKEKLRC